MGGRYLVTCFVGQVCRDAVGGACREGTGDTYRYSLPDYQSEVVKLSVPSCWLHHNYKSVQCVGSYNCLQSPPAEYIP